MLQTASLHDRLTRTHGWAWLVLTACLALHVADEAAHDFLALYNPIASRIRAAVPFLPVPVFSFPVWLAGLILAVIVLASLSRFAFLGRAWIRPASYVYAVFMLFNGLTHIVGSLYARRPLAGVVSAPLLVAASIFLAWSVPRAPAARVRPVP
jgi:hypothetical protein